MHWAGSRPLAGLNFAVLQSWCMQLDPIVAGSRSTVSSPPQQGLLLLNCRLKLET
jgi:hypothetical protein